MASGQAVRVDDALSLVAVETSAVASTPVCGELVSSLEPLAAAFVASLAAVPATQRTYRLACARFLAWLGPDAGVEALTVHTMAAYQADLAAPDAAGRQRASATVRKHRAALNSLLGWAAEHGALERRQAELARSVRLPRAGAQAREAPSALSDGQYARLVAVVTAELARDRLLLGTRDLAIVRTLGDAGLRCSELAGLERRDFLAARQGADVRVLHVRRGKGDRQRRVKLTPTAAAAIVAWDRERTRTLGAAAAHAPLFITLGRRRRDGSYTRLGGAVGEPVLADLIRRYGRRAGIPVELQHPHVLRHTMATRWRRRGRDPETLRRQLGHASMKTTQIYFGGDDVHEDAEVLAFDQAPLLLEADSARA